MPELNFINFEENKQARKDIKKLYKEAFPREEKMTFWLLKRLAKKENVEFYGIYDKEKFVGLIYNVLEKDILFVFYLAIDKNLRGQGYGSKILNAVKEKYKDYRIVLNIEEVNKNSNNYEQRVKRKQFYEKNGFYNLDYNIIEANVVYEMLCYDKKNKTVSKEEYSELMKNYFGKILYKYGYKKISEIISKE